MNVNDQQIKIIKDHFSEYNLIGINWGTAGTISVVIGCEKYAGIGETEWPSSYCYKARRIAFGLSNTKSRNQFLKKLLTSFIRGNPLTNIDKKTILNFIEEPEVQECVDRLMLQIESVLSDLLKERTKRRITELKTSFKTEVQAFVKRYHLSKDEVKVLVEESIREMEVEDIMHT